MGRPRKEDKQQKETAELMISVDEFKQTRDSVSRALFSYAPRLSTRHPPAASPSHRPRRH